MLVIFLTLCGLTSAWASTIDLSDCNAVRQPNYQDPSFDYYAFSQENSGRWRYARVPDVLAYDDIASQNFHIVPVKDSRVKFYVSLSYTMVNGTSGVSVVNEEVTDLGKGKTSITSGRDSATQYTLVTQVLGFKPDTYMVYSACSPNGSDKKSVWIFTLAKSKLSKNDKKQVNAIYKKYGASYKKLKMLKH